MATQALRPELADARQQGFHNIGEAAAATGVSAKMIRHYEAAGLIPTPQRTFAGYRDVCGRSGSLLWFLDRAEGLRTLPAAA